MFSGMYQFPVAQINAKMPEEISFLYAEGYTALEVKHGPIALLDDNISEYIHFRFVLVDK